MKSVSSDQGKNEERKWELVAGLFFLREKKKSRTFGKDSQDNSIMPFHVFPKSSKKSSFICGSRYTSNPILTCSFTHAYPPVHPTRFLIQNTAYFT